MDFNRVHFTERVNILCNSAQRPNRMHRIERVKTACASVSIKDVPKAFSHLHFWVTPIRGRLESFQLCDRVLWFVALTWFKYIHWDNCALQSDLFLLLSRRSSSCVATRVLVVIFFFFFVIIIIIIIIIVIKSCHLPRSRHRLVPYSDSLPRVPFALVSAQFLVSRC